MAAFILATRNRHKAGEIRTLLPGHWQCLTLADFKDPPETVEDAPTFAGNALKKARALAEWLGAAPDLKGRFAAAHPESLYVLADDSGLEVDVLNGAPGVRSARFAGETGSANTPDAANNAKLLRLLAGVPREKRGARFRCALALVPVIVREEERASPVCSSDDMELQSELFEGVCEGWIDFEERGKGGFGYDPLFVPNGYEQSFAELGGEVKNRMSHRAQALGKLEHWLRRGDG